MIEKQIRNLREQQHMTQQDLADKLRLSRQSISKWEQGVTYPDIDNIIQLSQLFNVSTDELLTGYKFIGRPFVIGIKPDRSLLIRKIMGNIYAVLSFLVTFFLIPGLWFETNLPGLGYVIAVSLALAITLATMVFAQYSDKTLPYWVIEDDAIQYIETYTFKEKIQRIRYILVHGQDNALLKSVAYADIASAEVTYIQKPVRDEDIIPGPLHYYYPTVLSYYILLSDMFIAITTKNGEKIRLDLSIEYYKNYGEAFAYFVEITKYFRQNNVVLTDSDNVIKRALSNENMT